MNNTEADTLVSLIVDECVRVAMEVVHPKWYAQVLAESLSQTIEPYSHSWLNAAEAAQAIAECAERINPYDYWVGERGLRRRLPEKVQRILDRYGITQD